MMLRPGKPREREKGQPEGTAVTSRTGRPGVAGTDRKTWNAASRNNSNLTPYAASVANGEWELLFGLVPIIVLYPLNLFYPACTLFPIPIFLYL